MNPSSDMKLSADLKTSHRKTLIALDINLSYKLHK